MGKNRHHEDVSVDVPIDAGPSELAAEASEAAHLNGAPAKKTREPLTKREAVMAIFRVLDRVGGGAKEQDEVLASVAALR